MKHAQPAPQAKLGTGHLQGMLRSGAKELAQALPAFPDSIKPVEEPGLVGNPVAHEVFQQRNPEELRPEQEMEMNMEL